MLIITLASAFASLLTYFLAKSYSNDSSRLMESRSEIVTTGIQIICGDCSGEQDLPRKTYLDRSGNCSQCGGHSYILAANRFIYTQQVVAMRLSQSQAVRDDCPVRTQKDREITWSLVSLTTRA
jgi:hypothetical protein